MTNDQLADLKQFIETTVSQQTAHLAADLKKDLKKTDEKVDTALELIEGIASVVEDIHREQTTLAKRVDNHETRIGRLEHKLA